MGHGCLQVTSIALGLDEKLGGNVVPASKLIPFNNFIKAYVLSEFKISGANWTWMNRQEKNPIAYKLDRLIVNDEWL